MPAKHPNPAGYSGTPLARKLGLKAGMRVLVLHPPRPYRQFFPDLPELQFARPAEPGPLDFVHLFATTFEQLEDGLRRAVPNLHKKGVLWVSWPKKTSGLVSEIGKFDVMAAGKRSGLVDIKVAAIDADWSGHKFVVPVKNR